MGAPIPNKINFLAVYVIAVITLFGGNAFVNDIAAITYLVIGLIYYSIVLKG